MRRKNSRLIIIFSILISIVLISCSSDPYAKNRKYHVITVGYDYTDTTGARSLPKDIDDAVQVAKCLYSLSNGNAEIHYILGSDTAQISKYGLSSYTSPTTANIKAAISTVAASAKKEDITVFYFSGHGDSSYRSKVSYEEGFTQDHILATKKNSTSYDEYPTAELLADLNTIQGTKLVIIDSCYSGGALPPNGISADSSLYEDTNVLDIFFNKDISVAYPSVFALTASSYYTTSSAGTHSHSKFTEVFLKALGWNDSNLLNPYQDPVLCRSGNEVTLSSLYDWIYSNGGVYLSQRPVASSTSADLVLFSL